ncbi:RiPP maturation radical SAM C-methyltransferase [Streptomyces viridochromogenes]|uniref:RiPP maturation radical SAM C-methyltransferase n=1 Tax=Streptomyces viridochromogenes TaxID=1938 RepID=UPI001EF3ADBF|nr:RiPP maturation radical SAM C-methyltransferase [Streptomyces viridochromogenes]
MTMRGETMRVTLVSMPWASIDTPSLALGVLAAKLRDTIPELSIDVRYVNVECAEWMLEVLTDAKRHDYDFFALKSYFMGCGDWVFSSALYGDKAWRVHEFADELRNQLSDREIDVCMRLHDAASDFINIQARAIAETKPDLVCFTSTFQQNVASLALACRLKELLPQVKCVMGGANCDGDQGKGLHRAFDCIDFVVRGEGERVFPELLRRLMASDGTADIPGLCWRDEHGAHANPMSDRLLASTEIPMPDHSAYFERIAKTAVSSWIEPRVAIEAARGCWWGEKHHCTFCGLNGSSMTFRSKSPKVFVQELEEMASQYKILDFYAVDNILDMGYLDTALRDIAQSPYDYRIQYEIKSNMKYHQLERLRDAGIVSVQPGIENLSSKVLRIMDKGVSGAQNVRMLRDAESLGLTVAWNYLYGFPGETSEHYLSVISQLPMLHHLHPAEGTSRIALERFSPYFDRPELGFAYRWPHRQYAMIYDLPESELHKIAYLFETVEHGIGGEVLTLLERALSLWGEQHYTSSLSYQDFGDGILLSNTRPDFDWSTVELRAPEEVFLFRALYRPRTLASLISELGKAGIPLDADPSSVVRALVTKWQWLGLVFSDDGCYVHVVTTAENQQLCRIRRRSDEGLAA